MTKFINLFIIVSLVLSNLQANLTFENLANTSYNKGSNLNISANLALKTYDKDNIKTNEPTIQGSGGSPENKITGANYANSRSLGYSSSKTLATIGQGNLIISDTTNSDDTDRLNRNTDEINKDLYNTQISSNIQASIDTRLFTADGREQIKQDIKEVRQGLGKLALQAILGDEGYKQSEVINNELAKLKETDPQRYKEVSEAIVEYNNAIAKQEQNLIFVPAIPAALSEFLTLCGITAVAGGTAYTAKKIGDKYNSSDFDFTDNGLDFKSSYIPKPTKDELDNDDFLPDLTKAKPKTPVNGGGGLRPRWKDKDGNIYEWDSQHGEMEIYDKQGKHQGSYNPKSKEKKPPVKNRKVEK